MLAALRESESADVYQAAARGAELVAFSLMIVNLTIQPIISRLHASGDLARLQRVVTNGARAALALSLPIALVLVVFAKSILVDIFGPDFARGANCLGILCIAQIASGFVGSVDQILNMTGHERDTAIGMFIGAGTNIMLNAALIPMWDIEGAAIATGLSLVLWKLFLAIRVNRRLGISCTALGRLANLQ